MNANQLRSQHWSQGLIDTLKILHWVYFFNHVKDKHGSAFSIGFFLLRHHATIWGPRLPSPQLLHCFAEILGTIVLSADQIASALSIAVAISLANIARLPLIAAVPTEPRPSGWVASSLGLAVGQWHWRRKGLHNITGQWAFYSCI